jgi:hypothetical protein
MTSETDKLLNQWLEDDERQERERLEWERIAKLDEERAEGRNRVYRGIGYITRPLVYIAEAAALLVLLYWWLEPKNLTNRTLGSLTVGEIGQNVVWAVLSLVGIIVLWGLFFAKADGGFEEVEWEAWGKFGLGLVVLLGAAGLWFAYG